jgi:hypothetical protein
MLSPGIQFTNFGVYLEIVGGGGTWPSWLLIVIMTELRNGANLGYNKYMHKKKFSSFSGTKNDIPRSFLSYQG